MDKLNLTDVERLILANQYQILDKLEPNNGYGNLAEHLKNGHSFFYNTGLLNWFDNVMSDEDQKLVIDILDMFSILQDSFNKLEDKSGIEESRLKFRGFDFNDSHEICLSNFVDALLKERRFINVIPHHSLNSHTQMLSRYKALLDRFNKIGRKFPFSKKEIQDVVG